VGDGQAIKGLCSTYLSGKGRGSPYALSKGLANGITRNEYTTIGRPGKAAKKSLHGPSGREAQRNGMAY